MTKLARQHEMIQFLKVACISERSAHLVFVRRRSPWPWAFPRCSCEAFWLEAACRPRLLVQPTSQGKPPSYAPLGHAGEENYKNDSELFVGCMRHDMYKVKGQASTYPLLARGLRAPWAGTRSSPTRSSACSTFPLIWRFLSRHCRGTSQNFFLLGCWPPANIKKLFQHTFTCGLNVSPLLACQVFIVLFN